MDSVLNIANIHLVAFSFLFTNLRLNDLALANTFTLLFLNSNTERKEAHIFGLFANGLVTFILGYPYFLTQNKNHGVYMCLLGSLTMAYSALLHTRQILEHYKKDFQAQDEDGEVEEEVAEQAEAESMSESDADAEDEEDYSDMPPLIPVRRTDSISDYPALAEAIRRESIARPPPIEIPPLDVNRLLAEDAAASAAAPAVVSEAENPKED